MPLSRCLRRLPSSRLHGHDQLYVRGTEKTQAGIPASLILFSTEKSYIFWRSVWIGLECHILGGSRAFIWKLSMRWPYLTDMAFPPSATSVSELEGSSPVTGDHWQRRLLLLALFMTP